jgi:hypothetical protein
MDIDPGTEWDQEIHRHLAVAQMILLLISADFINSDYCWTKEMQLALKRHESRKACVIPIIVRPVSWQHYEPLSKLQALPEHALPITDWPNPDRAFLNIAEGIRKVVSAIRVKEREISDSAQISISSTDSLRSPKESTSGAVPVIPPPASLFTQPGLVPSLVHPFTETITPAWSSPLVPASNLTNTYQAQTGTVQTFSSPPQHPPARPMPTRPEPVTYTISRPPVSKSTTTTVVAYRICCISWIIFEIIMILIDLNVSNLGHPLEDEIVWPILSLLSIALFFSWGWIMAQKTGKTDASKLSRSIGIAAITLFGGPIYWGIGLYQEGNTPGGYAPFLIGNAIEGILVGTILIAPVLLLVSWAVGSGATLLGGLIGKRFSRN